MEESSLSADIFLCLKIAMPQIDLLKSGSHISNYGDTVFDPFCGTGTTMMASLRYGRNSIGIDIDPEYCRMAASHLKKEGSNLFFDAKLSFEKMTFDNTGLVQVCEDQAFYKVRSARGTMR